MKCADASDRESDPPSSSRAIYPWRYYPILRFLKHFKDISGASKDSLDRVRLRFHMDCLRTGEIVQLVRPFDSPRLLERHTRSSRTSKGKNSLAIITHSPCDFLFPLHTNLGVYPVPLLSVS